MKNKTRAVIFGCEGLSLTDSERDFFKRTQPLGFILFARNCDNPDQIKSLTRELQACVDHLHVPILIDQEGGRVARLKAPHWRQYPEASLFGQLAEDDINLACWAVETNSFLIGCELRRLGINVNCSPLLDLPVSDAHPIIGSRAFSEQSDITSILGYQAVGGFQRAGIIPIIKHLPGHGRALVDSHEELPVVSASLEDLQETDFWIFKNVCEQIKEDGLPLTWGMTAHVIYSAIDRQKPATLSEAVIEKVIRRFIGFEGFLISDCLTMKALKGDMGERVKEALSAGCDTVLHCNGDLNEMISVACQTSLLSTKSLERLKASMISAHTLNPENEENLWIELNYQLKNYWSSQRRAM